MHGKQALVLSMLCLVEVELVDLAPLIATLLLVVVVLPHIEQEQHQLLDHLV
jgi:hypothetical protein|tara:strand:+ start:946 stop:1101 length:156 start_codon:yes stop_codon:yes gene_type:complete